MSELWIISVLAASGLAVSGLTVLLLFHALAHRMLSCAPKSAGFTPGVSILKPLKGLDDGLLENLCSFAEQNYPKFEILIGTEDERDPALEVAREVQSRYPKVPIRILTQGRRIGLNPKVNNLAHLAARASFEYWLVSDSNVRVEPDYLRQTAAEFEDPGVGLVSNLVAGIGEQGIGALFENLHLNSFVLGCIAGVERMTGHVCVVGKSILFRRSDLERLGGFQAFANYLAEDYWLGQRFAQEGWKVVTSCHVVHTVNRTWSLGRFVSRHVRWSQMRRRIWLTAYLAELLTNPTPWLLALVVLAWGSEAPLGWPERGLVLGALVGLAIKLVSDGFLMARLQKKKPKLWGLLCIPLKDLLILAVWAVALFKRATYWRGNRVYMGRGSLLLPASGETDHSSERVAVQVST